MFTKALYHGFLLDLPPTLVGVVCLLVLLFFLFEPGLVIVVMGGPVIGELVSGESLEFIELDDFLGVVVTGVLKIC